jgi:hypothetical protein
MLRILRHTTFCAASVPNFQTRNGEKLPLVLAAVVD